MLKILIKSRFYAMFASITQGNKNNKKKSKASPILLAILFAFLIVYFAFAMGMMAYGLCISQKGTDSEWSVFVLATIVSCALCLFGSIFATKTQIFESSDNELLLSMPIPPKYIFISRMVALLLVNYMLEAIVMIPCILMYGIVIGYTFLGFVFSLLVFLLIPFLTLSVSCLIAWIISEIASRMKNKTFITVVLFLVFFLGYMFICGSIGEKAGSGELEKLDFDGLKNTFVFYFAADAMSNGNAFSLLLFALCVFVPSILTYIILDKCFIRIITTKRTKAKVEYKGNKEKSNSVYISLLKKEIRRFFSSSAYIMNAGLGNILSLVLAIVIAVSAKDIKYTISLISSELGSDTVKGFVPFALTCICIFMGALNLVSAPSISLENKNLWILQAAPIDPKDVLMAKLSCHMIICIPLSLISTVILCVAFEVGVIASLLSVVSVLCAVAFTGYWGLFLGLKFPKFDWQNENVAVKQGFAVFGAMFGSMLLFMILMGIGAVITFISPYIGFFALIFPLAIISVIIHYYLVNGGCKVFEDLKK